MSELTTTYASIIAGVVNLPSKQVVHTLELLEEDATIPFIARYRKEVTGGLDEVQIGAIQTQLEKMQEIDKRRATILKTIEELGQLTPELEKRIRDTWDSTELEDIYLPYKPKRRTRAEIAKKKGLEPLAQWLLMQQGGSVEAHAKQFLGDEVKDVEEALQGARDIVAEMVNEDERARNVIRRVYQYTAHLEAKVVKAKEEEGQNYKDYFDWNHGLNRVQSHQLLAIRRGENEGVLKVKIQPDDEESLDKLDHQFVRGRGACSDQVAEAVEDAYKRLLSPSIATEYGTMSKEKADDEAIMIFAQSLKQLLLAAPLGQKRVLALDPGYRTGCKLVCLDEQGNLLEQTAIYPHPPQNKTTEAAAVVERLVVKHKIQAIAIGNGTASRETKSFVDGLHFTSPVDTFVVSEQGASIYSASAIAREEFPDQDVTVRGAVSIGRRLMDPLAELVKIDPKSIGVGQYQHDVNQTKLKKALDQVVENCVNQVGVNLNTASAYLLTYIAGLGPTLAKNIVSYRAENGAFTSRKDLLNVPRLGQKAYVQAAGFLRIPKAKNPLDGSAVHPESYALVEQMAKDQGCSVADLMKDASKREAIDLQRYVHGSVGMPTLKDIMAELAKPNRDPREQLTAFAFDEQVRVFEDLQIGMSLPAVIGNITAFGAFADIGIKENGLIHISQMANRRISSPTEVVSIGQQVMVEVIDIDSKRRRISLRLKR